MQRILVLLFLLSFTQISCSENNLTEAIPCKSIVSLSPSITNILQLLNLEKNIQAATKFDFLIAKEKRLLGGYLDFNLESLYLLKTKPQIIFGLEENLRAFSQQKKFNFINLNHNNLATYLLSIKTIADICNKKKLAVALNNRYKKLLNKYINSTHQKITKSLIILNYDGNLKNSFVLGKNTFLGDIFKLFNIDIILSNSKLFSEISLESLLKLKLNNFIVINMNKFKTLANNNFANIIPIIKEEQFYYLNGNEFKIPGYKFSRMLKKINYIRLNLSK